MHGMFLLYVKIEWSNVFKVIPKLAALHCAGVVACHFSTLRVQNLYNCTCRSFMCIFQLKKTTALMWCTSTCCNFQCILLVLCIYVCIQSWLQSAGRAAYFLVHICIYDKIIFVSENSSILFSHINTQNSDYGKLFMRVQIFIRQRWRGVSFGWIPAPSLKILCSFAMKYVEIVIAGSD